MSKHYIKYYPVDNGDTTLLKLKDNTTVLIDCKIRDGEETDDGRKIFAVKDDLLKEVEKRGGNPAVDLFILTHSDKDHCQGFDKHFYTGDPANYSKSHRENDEIIVDELWVTSMLFNHAKNDDATALQEEAERRRKLWESDHSSKDSPGNRLRMIGYDEDERYECLPNSVPGEIVNEIGGETKADFEFFVHAPFKQSVIDCNANEDHNGSSIILQARFKANASDEKYACFAMFGGDADHYRWEQVLEKSKKNDNEDKLEWDIFMTPHHCSWTYFNDVKYKDNPNPQEYSLEILDYKKGSGKIIAASKPIKNNDDNPPHHPAKKEYLEKVENDDDFIELAKYPKEKEPKPYVFEITAQGPKEQKDKQGTALASAGGALGSVNKKSEYGSGAV